MLPGLMVKCGAGAVMSGKGAGRLCLPSGWQARAGILLIMLSVSCGDSPVGVFVRKERLDFDVLGKGKQALSLRLAGGSEFSSWVGSGFRGLGGRLASGVQATRASIAGLSKMLLSSCSTSKEDTGGLPLKTGPMGKSRPGQQVQSREYQIPESLSLDFGLSIPKDEHNRDASGVVNVQSGAPPAYSAPCVAINGNAVNSSAAFEVMLDCLPDGVPAASCQIILHRKHCRTMRPDVEEKIEWEWEKQKLKSSGVKLYDGKLFRFGSCQRWLEADGSQEVRIELGVTRYRSFIGTNMARGWETLPQEHHANPISCVAVVHTLDSCVMLIRRSDKVQTSKSAVALPGGYVNPDRAKLHDSIAQVPLPTEENQEIKCVYGYSLWPGCRFWRPMHHEPDARPYSCVVREFFDCPVREACEELGLPREAFPDSPLLLGVTRSRRNQRPSAAFYLRTPLTSRQVIQYHSQFHSFESDTCIAVKDKDALSDIDFNMPSESRGALYLFSLFRMHQYHTIKREGDERRLRENALAPPLHRASGVTTLPQAWRVSSPAADLEQEQHNALNPSANTPERQSRVRLQERHEAARSPHSPASRPISTGVSRVPSPPVEKECFSDESRGHGASSPAWQQVNLEEVMHLEKVVHPDLSIETFDKEFAGRSRIGSEPPQTTHTSAHSEDGRERSRSGPRTLRRCHSDADLQRSTQSYNVDQEDEEEELTRAIYWWMSKSQDPETIERALFELDLDGKIEEELTIAQMNAVLQRRLQILEESSSTSSSEEDSDEKERKRREKAQERKRKKRKWREKKRKEQEERSVLSRNH